MPSAGYTNHAGSAFLLVVHDVSSYHTTTSLIIDSLHCHTISLSHYKLASETVHAVSHLSHIFQLLIQNLHLHPGYCLRAVIFENAADINDGWAHTSEIQ